MMVPIQIIGQHLDMELDTAGAAISVISESTFTSIFKDLVTVQPSNIVLHTYLGKELSHTRYCWGWCNLWNAKGYLPSGNSQRRRLVWPELAHTHLTSHLSINALHNGLGIQEKMKQHPGLFGHELGTFKGVESKIFVPQNAQPHFYKLCPVPYVLKQKVEEDCLQEEGIITPVQFSDWATPISASSQVGWKNTNLWWL